MSQLALRLQYLSRQGSGTVGDIPSDDVSEWLEMIYDRDEQLQQLTNEALRLEAEEDVDRLLESGQGEEEANAFVLGQNFFEELNQRVGN